VVQLKVLSDRRSEGGGIAWLVRMTPPAGKLSGSSPWRCRMSTSSVWRVAVATKSGEQLRAKGNYGLNAEGAKPHSAFIGTETVSLVIYNGEPDEIRSIDVIDKPAD